jgi:hypothetical protein
MEINLAKVHDSPTDLAEIEHQGVFLLQLFWMSDFAMQKYAWISLICATIL